MLVLGFGSHAVLTGTMQIGDLVAFLLLMAFLYDPLSRLHQLNQLVQAGRAAGERVFDILDEKPEPGFGGEAGGPAPRSPIASTASASSATFDTKMSVSVMSRVYLRSSTFHLMRRQARRLHWLAPPARENRRW